MSIEHWIIGWLVGWIVCLVIAHLFNCSDGGKMCVIDDLVELFTTFVLWPLYLAFILFLICFNKIDDYLYRKKYGRK